MKKLLNPSKFLSTTFSSPVLCLMFFFLLCCNRNNKSEEKNFVFELLVSISRKKKHVLFI